MKREDLEKFKSTILGWITSAGGGSGPFAPSPHDLNSAHHTGNISDAQHGTRTQANAHAHNHLSGVTADQHHAQSHAHNGADGSGVVAHSATTGRTANDHHNQQHTLATNAGLGADHTISGAALGWVLRATSAVAAAWAQLQHSDLGGVTADQHHAQAHAISGADHTGTLTEGQLPATAILESDAATAAPTVVSNSGATVGTALKYAREDHRHNIYQALTAIWTGNHTFQGLLKTRHVEPEAGELYDIGLATKRYRTLRVAELAATLFSKEQIMVLGNKIIIAKDADTLPAAMTNVQTTYNFGRAMTPNDWIQITAEDTAGNPSTEWLKVGTLVSGTTYNITRNVDGSGANAWTEGTPYIVIGQNGDYRIELSAGASARIDVIRQSNAWNAWDVLASMNQTGFVVDDNGGVGSMMFQTGDNNQVIAWFYSFIAGGLNTAFVKTNDELPAGEDAEINFMADRRKTLGGKVTAKFGAGSTEAMPSARPSMRIGSEASYDDNLGKDQHFNFVRSGVAYPIQTPAINADPIGSLLSIPGMRMVWHGNGYIGNAAASSLMDRLGADHHLTPNNGPADAQYQNSPFPPINYTDLNGTNQWYHRANEAAFNDVNYLDIWAVVSFDVLPTAGQIKTIYRNGQTTPSWMLYLYETGGLAKLQFETFSSGGVSSYCPSGALAANTRYVIRAQFIASTLMALTVNGTKTTGTAAATMRAPTGNFELGRMNGSHYLDGKYFAGGLAVNAAGETTYNAVFHSLRDYLGV
ncbi:MAG: hypothetical protein CVU44_21085 [Chloroflexi bacterium HGW-Chloroflexi-6]|nr:MAG: hypothetical protein CVU44_21085 [Chloroflexi bacterium HGW-Chloroflexi-6]